MTEALSFVEEKMRLASFAVVTEGVYFVDICLEGEVLGAFRR